MTGDTSSKQDKVLPQGCQFFSHDFVSVILRYLCISNQLYLLSVFFTTFLVFDIMYHLPLTYESQAKKTFRMKRVNPFGHCGPDSNNIETVDVGAVSGRCTRLHISTL